MEQSPRASDRSQILRIAISCIGGIIVVPAILGIFGSSPLHEVFGFVGSILIFQPVAAGFGIALGIPPVPVLLIMLSVGTSVIFIFFGICDLFYDKSVWLRAHIDKVNSIAKRSALFQKYGILTLVPFIWVPGIGLYGCVLLAWLFGWRDLRGIGIILAGWMLASILVVGATLGALEVIG